LVNPRSFIYALHTHWDVIESLVVLGRDFPSFEQAQVVDLILRRAPGKGMDASDAILRQMVTADLLQAISRGTALQINQLILEFVRGLTLEHELGLSAVFKGREWMLSRVRPAS
jgi:hypothetical protein